MANGNGFLASFPDWIKTVLALLLAGSGLIWWAVGLGIEQGRDDEVLRQIRTAVESLRHDVKPIADMAREAQFQTRAHARQLERLGKRMDRLEERP